MRSGLLTHTHTAPPVQGLCSLQDQRTGLCLCQSKITSPHRRAEATGRLQAKVKCSWCGHAKWVVFSKLKSCLHCPACQILRVLYSCTTKSPFSFSSSPDTQQREMTQEQEMTHQREMTHPRTKVVLQSRQFSASSCTDCSAYSSCSTKSPVALWLAS